MFRIKTDIRQYKCETKDKVEKLIRNWVIRPNDLIYDADGKDWAPIGAHPSFVDLFGMLDEQEKNTPDTVVTVSPYTDREEAHDEPGNGVADASPEEIEEVTRLVGRPTVADSEAEDGRTTDVFDQEEIADSLSATKVPKPTAPDGVEPIRNDGEVTMMTERTFDMLKTTDEDEARAQRERDDAAKPGDPTHVESSDVDDDEVHDALEPIDDSDVDVDDDDDADEERGDDAEEPADQTVLDAGDDEADDADEEITGVRERKNAESAEPATPDDDDEPALPKPAIAKVLESGPKLGRHDLPEELFATNEISSPEVQEQMKRLDELAELAEPSEPTKSEPAPTKPAGDAWPERLDEDSGVDEAWDVVADDLRTTEDVGLDTASPDAATEEVERDNFDDDDEWEEDTSEPELAAAASEFVSDGYKIPLPFPVRPTADDIRLGMPQGRVSNAVKDRNFPAPEPKKLNEIHRRVFDLSPPVPRDRTWVIAAVFVVILVICVTIVASC